MDGDAPSRLSMRSDHEYDVRVIDDRERDLETGIQLDVLRGPALFGTVSRRSDRVLDVKDAGRHGRDTRRTAN
jgi:hypothetical protein